MEYRILLVDNNSGDAALLSQYLRIFNGFKIVQVSSLKELERMNPMSKFDIIICDVEITGEPSIDSVIASRIVHPGVPIIALSSNKSLKLLEELALCGVEEYINKNNMNPELLHNTVVFALLKKCRKEKEETKASLSSLDRLAIKAREIAKHVNPA